MEISRLLSNVFNAVKEIYRLRRELNRLLGKGIPNIYGKVTIETFWNFDFLSLKNLLLGQFWGAPAQGDIIEF